MKKRQLFYFFALYVFYNLAANLVHPVTPAFLQSINCPDSMFGLAFAAMAFTNFLFCPLWGKLSDRYGYVKVMAISCLGYAAGTLVFASAQGSLQVVLGRMLAGVFLGGQAVASMAYLSAMNPTDEERGKSMAIYAAIQSIAGAAGYLIGGLVGDRGVMTCFYLQVGCLVCICLLTRLMLKEVKAEAAPTGKLTMAEVNPFSSIASSLRLIDGPMAIFLLTVFLASFANFTHDNNFNYFLRAKLDFPPSGNGIFKAVVGIIALVANSTINMWIVRKTDTRKAIVVIFGLCSLSLTLMVLSSGVPAFLATALAYYTFSVIFLPLQQTQMIRNDSGSAKGVAAGLFNASRSLGMMAGPAFAGLVFSMNANLPFVVAALSFGATALLCAYNARQYRQVETTQK